MIWLSWRQSRVHVVAVTAVLAVAAVLYMTTRPGLLHLYEQSPTTFIRLVAADRTDVSLFFGALLAVMAAPALLGMFWGAPLVARELEAGTHRLAWNQSVSRTRWLVTRLALGGLAAMAGTGLLSLVTTWWSEPINKAVTRPGQDLSSAPSGLLNTRIMPLSFIAHGITPIGYAAFGFTLGVAVGAFLRRTVPAMALTLAIFVAVQVIVPQWVRPHFAPAARVTTTITRDTVSEFMWAGPSGPLHIKADIRRPGAWIIANETIDPAGHAIDSVPQSVAPNYCRPPAEDGTRGPDPLRNCTAALTALGYRQRVTYQPAGRYWRLQWTETAVFLALSVLLGAACLRRVRRVS